MTAVDIGEQLKALVELQALDKQIYDLQRRRQAKPPQIEQLKAAHQAQTQRVKDAEAQLKALQVKRGSMDGDLAAKEAHVKKLQMQLYQVKTNKEYTAMQREIEGAKADNSVLEEEILKVMEQIDQQKAAIAGVAESLKSDEAAMRAAVAAVEQEMAVLDTAIAGLQAQRQASAPRVEAKVLARYERILEKKEGVGLVAVDPRLEACGGCHMNVPPQTINEIRLKERLIACESCARLLYYPEDVIA
ncbi:MAG: hypothetical protein HY600_04985 [Candidatus Omnitrophica bacterium]|nr:hypothetical protein [Candidatus Omnitrophota bacterium]